MARLGIVAVGLALVLAACSGGEQEVRVSDGGVAATPTEMPALAPTFALTPQATPIAKPTAAPTETPAPTPTPGLPATPAPRAQAQTTEAGLYVVRPDGSGLRELLSAQRGLISPFQWSPDGKRVAIIAGPCGDRKALVAERDSESVQELTGFAGLPADITWAPDSHRLVVHVSEQGPQAGLPRVFLLDISGQTVPEELFRGIYPAWSPHGDSIAYADQVDNSWNVKVLNLADGATTSVADGLAMVIAIAWAPDGRRLAYTTPDGTFVVDADGGERRVVASGPSWAGLVWMPDGQRLVVGSPEGVGLVSTGGGPIQVLRTGSVFDVSSDGRFVAVYDNLGDGRTEIEVFDVVAGESHVVTGGLMPLGDVVSLSPDGTQLLFNSQPAPRGGRRELYVVNADGTALRKLVEPTVDIGGGADWSADGRFILFNDTVITGCE
jgi:Tol biopolymer transport system component